MTTATSVFKVKGWQQAGALPDGSLVESEIADFDGQIAQTGWIRIAGFSLECGRIPEYNQLTGETRYVLPETDYEIK